MNQILNNFNSKKNIKKGIKRTKYLFDNKIIDFSKLFSSIENYKHSYPYTTGNDAYNIFNRSWGG